MTPLLCCCSALLLLCSAAALLCCCSAGVCYRTNTTTRLNRDLLEVKLLEARHEVDGVQAVILLVDNLIVQQRQHRQLRAAAQAL